MQFPILIICVVFEVLVRRLQVKIIKTFSENKYAKKNEAQNQGKYMKSVRSYLIMMVALFLVFAPPARGTCLFTDY